MHNEGCSRYMRRRPCNASANIVYEKPLPCITSCPTHIEEYALILQLFPKQHRYAPGFHALLLPDDAGLFLRADAMASTILSQALTPYGISSNHFVPHSFSACWASIADSGVVAKIHRALARSSNRYRPSASFKQGRSKIFFDKF